MTSSIEALSDGEFYIAIILQASIEKSKKPFGRNTCVLFWHLIFKRRKAEEKEVLELIFSFNIQSTYDNFYITSIFILLKSDVS